MSYIIIEMQYSQLVNRFLEKVVLSTTISAYKKSFSTTLYALFVVELFSQDSEESR